MTTLYFTRQFTKGTLKGICHNDKISFVSVKAATDWLKGVAKNANRIGYVIVDKSFQNYQR